MTSDVAPPPITRGRTVIDDRVRQRLIERAVLAVPGVVPRRTLIPGRALPAVAVSGDRPPDAVAVQIAAVWPVETAAVLAAVRTAVAEELSASVAERPERIDVTIARIESDRTPAQVAAAYDADVDLEPAAANHRRLAPRRAALAGYSGVLIALVLVATGVVAIREALTPADPWIAPALRWLAQAHWQWWAWPVACAVAVLGLVLLAVSFAPRRRTHVCIGDHVWVPRDSAARWAVADDAEPNHESGGEIR